MVFNTKVPVHSYSGTRTFRHEVLAMIRNLFGSMDTLVWRSRVRKEVQSLLLEDGIRVAVPHPELNLRDFWSFEHAAY